jgi:hypothetical protein
VAPAQIVGELTVTVGKGVTVTVDTAVFVHPDWVPVTVYVVVEAGETEIGFVLAPVLQLYVVPPEPVSVAEAPAQMVGELTVTVGNGVTVTFDTAVFVQPALVPVTV